MLAAKDIHAALHLADAGRKSKETERFIRIYYSFLDCIECRKAGKKTDSEAFFEENRKLLSPDLFTRFFGKNPHEIKTQEYEKIIKEDAEELCRIFLNAVNGRDSETIFEIGNAIEFAKKINPPADPVRSKILFLETFLEKDEKLPIRDVARFVQWPDMKSQDGFARLRRLCIELNFPLAKTRQISGR